MSYPKTLLQLTGVIRQQKTAKELKELFEAITTPKELEMMLKRMEILEMLFNNIPHREIAKKLNLGLATVTRGSVVVKALEQNQPNWWKDFKSW